MVCPNEGPNGETIVAKGPCEVPPADRNVMYENRILGLPRIRMLKVGNKSCEVPLDFQQAIRVCFAPYKEQFEDQLTYIPTFRKYTSEEA